MNYDQIEVINRTLQAKMYHKNELLLTYNIEYPWFVSKEFLRSVLRMNQFYATKAQNFQQYCREELFALAVDQYDYAMENGYPIRMYEAVLAYHITYNETGMLSLYFDQYEFSGGAHGNTIRNSQTWNLQTGHRICLGQLFYRPDYKETLIAQIIAQIEEQMASGINYYFDDYIQNVAYNFNPCNFYLTPNGVVIYFQQYEIAPYASGIPEFIIPYPVPAMT